jgi:hypothetical protein
MFTVLFKLFSSAVFNSTESENKKKKRISEGVYKKGIHFHEKTSVGSDESLSCPIDLKLILFFLLSFGKTSQKTDSLLSELYFKQKENANNLP